MAGLVSRAAASIRFRLQRLREATPSRTVPDPKGEGMFRIPDMDPQLAGLKRDQLVDLYWQSHPRFLFFKSPPPGARLLDIGAGSGGLSFWREYGSPRRTDLRMFAVDRQRGTYFDNYEAAFVADLDSEAIGFNGIPFEAVLASHVFEHLKDPQAVLTQVAGRLVSGGRAYIEVPSPASKDLPKREAFVARGWPMTISNFFDDGTHLETFSLDQLVAMGAEAGLEAVAAGAIEMPFMADSMIRYGLDHGDAEVLLYGYWAKTRWAHYVVLEKPRG
jgi:SAM-dependent methyltransferase